MSDVIQNNGKTPGRWGGGVAGTLAQHGAAAGVAGFALLAVTAPSTAWAQNESTGYSIDIEFLRPAFGAQGFAGVDVPVPGKNLTLRYGALLQYEQNPLTLYEAISNEELGSVVKSRFSGMLGASLDLHKVTFSVLVPTAANWGSDVEAFAQDGFGIADAGASARLSLLNSKVFNLGARGGLILPTGRQNAYIGESSVRFGLGALASVNVGSLTVATDLGLATRPRVETTEDFVAANEVTWGNALRYKLPESTHVGLNLQVLSRASLRDFLQGGAENALEAIAGVEVYPNRQATVTVGAGRGLTEGYGTTDFRVMSSLTISVERKEVERIEYVEAEPPPPPPPPEISIPEPEVVFEEGEVAKVVGEEIRIKEMVQFVVDTNIIQEYSKPTLAQVAQIINDKWNIAHVVIEGHASKEGDYTHNYELAESRARRIWEFMMELGVEKDRISYRGMGEVEPVLDESGQPVEGEDEESLQKNRRVRFLIVRQYADAAEFPKDFPATQILPWNGQTVTVVKPVVETKKEDDKPAERRTDEFGIVIDDEEIDIGAAPDAPAPTPDEE